TEELQFEIFTRKAEGFPAFIIVLRKQSTNDIVSGTIDFSNVCSCIIPKIIYPSNKILELHQPLPSPRVYLKSSDGQPMIYVFKCCA
ncbi:unnamed protein product, partial [Schistosoma turkestanicum]